MRYLLLVLLCLVVGCGGAVKGAKEVPVAAARTPDDLEVREQAFRNAAESFLKSAEINATNLDSPVSSNLYFEFSARYQKELDSLPDARHSRPLNLAFESMKMIPKDFHNIGRYLDLAESFAATDPDKSAECLKKSVLVLDLIVTNINNAREALLITVE